MRVDMYVRMLHVPLYWEPHVQSLANEVDPKPHLWVDPTMTTEGDRMIIPARTPGLDDA